MSVSAAVTRVAVLGNPNSGKSTLFNALTGMRQRVGNYPGVTVERKVGRCRGSHGEPIELIDLPGTYSLQVRSPDEAVARDVLLGRVPGEARPDVILAVVDASNLERNLYLVAQLMELRLPVVVALNMVDLAEAAGTVLDVPRIAEALGAEVVPTVASSGRGLVELRQALTRAPGRGPGRWAPLLPVVEKLVAPVSAALVEAGLVAEPQARAEALLLATSPVGEGRPEQTLPGPVTGAVERARAAAAELGLDLAAVVVDGRYAWVAEIAGAGHRRAEGHSRTVSDRIDAVATHWLGGWVVFLGVMGLMFFTIFSLAEYPMGWIESAQGWLSAWLVGVMPASEFRDLVVDGIVAGVGGVVVFLPQILVLFLFIGLLEDTGYMARAAFIIDRVMNRVGLQGRSFIPLLSSFACAIPGVMAARTIDSRKDRFVTILVAPLMSCSARLPVYTLLILVMMGGAVAAPAKAGIVLAMYVLGMAAAFGLAWVLRRTVFRGERSMLLLEMPPYRVPVWRTLAMKLLERAGLFLKRAGTVILALSVLIWIGSTYPKPEREEATPAEALEHSVIGRLGKAIEPVIAPLGYDWKIGVGLVTSMAAREVFVGTMAIIYSVEDDDAEAPALREALAAERRADGTPVYTPLVCVGLMVFYVLALQCISTVAIVRRELNSWGWALFQLGVMTGMAWVAALVVYQGGKLLGLGGGGG